MIALAGALVVYMSVMIGGDGSFLAAYVVADKTDCDAAVENVRPNLEEGTTVTDCFEVSVPVKQ